MIRRDGRNLGKRVRVLRGLYAGREGLVKGFRGDVERGVPWVFVYLYDSKDIQPISGANLETIGKKGEK